MDGKNDEFVIALFIMRNYILGKKYGLFCLKEV